MTLATPITSLRAASENLFRHCANLRAGDKLVILHEAAQHGWYDAQLAPALCEEALAYGLEARLVECLPPGETQPATVHQALDGEAAVVFLCRLGDLDRFDLQGEKSARVMVYARSLNDFASSYCAVPHSAMKALKHALDKLLLRAEEIVITCQDGTHLTGRAPAPARPAQDVSDVSIHRFPLGVPAPILASGFSGVVALTHDLTPTGNRPYEPAVLPVEGKVFAQLQQGRITGFTGDAEQVERILTHYARVSLRFGLDPWVVHSWHAGMHPSHRYFSRIGQDADFWSNTVFPNPRVLHFHTCGATPPGEISWNLVDATVTLDGVALWERGVLRPQNFPQTAKVLAEHPLLARAFQG